MKPAHPAESWFDRDGRIRWKEVESEKSGLRANAGSIANCDSTVAVVWLTCAKAEPGFSVTFDPRR